MTGAEVAQIITSLGTLVAALASALTLLQSIRNGNKATRIEANVLTIEKATNSMKDALVTATGKASLAEGTAAGIVEGHAAGLEQGRKEERKEERK